MRIPHNRAIELLEERLNDLKNPSIIIEAFKNRLQGDIVKIYGSGQEAISAVTLPIPNSFTKDEELKIIKETYIQTIEGWIKSIQDFHIIDQEIIVVSEKEFEIKYIDLLSKWNELIPEYNDLLKDSEKLRYELDNTISENRILREKISEKRIIGEKIKILFLGASPLDEVKLRINEEVREIETGLKMASLRDNFDLKSEWAVTTKTLQQSMLDEKPTIVHFSGHGDYDGIYLEDSLGNSKLIENEAIENLFELFSENVKCVFLNSCYSASQASLISNHIPYVIGMKSSVLDEVAILFSVGFYAALGAGRDIPFAYKMGLLRIKLEGIEGSDIPVLIE